MSVAKKLAGGGSAFSSLSAAKGGDTAAAAEARSEALGRARKASSVPLADVVFNPRNPRKTYSEEAIDETAASMREIGQTTAITVVSRMAFLDAHPDVAQELLGDASFVALDGNRRIRAAGRAGLEKIRVDLQDDLAATSSAMLEAALIANIHRENVPPIEEAEAIQELLDTVHGGNQAAVARRLGKTAAWVGQRLALLHLAPEVKEMVESKELGVKEARKLGAATRAGTLPREEQVAKAREARDQPAPVTVARPRTEPDVNPVYSPSPSPSASSTSTASYAPDVNPVYTDEQTGGTEPAAGTEGSGIPSVTLTVDPNDPAGFAVSIRLATTPRQAAAVARALIELLDSEHNAETVGQPA
ncbi:ParB/RepB/Spo0J family partition protein [Streptomyces sp. TLI_171]|uniref:ParB/RepB/Spo0J family partition protein n=1 Tax=Streptomyces sp. TLI_171 TaxID=1938859 RepID=UPI000C19D69E|nr:ParB/RepB/Spo0J family partition protein [Streptomyces sp. TLI_171]RKE02916.1 ParB family chromosome partitioning protein [Streptomyces sp. TLI_171]